MYRDRFKVQGSRFKGRYAASIHIAALVLKYRKCEPIFSNLRRFISCAPRLPPEPKYLNLEPLAQRFLLLFQYPEPLDHAIDDGFGAGGAAGDVDVYGDGFVHAA